MSTMDSIVLAACYALTLIYIYVQLNRAGTVKSRTGLVMAIITQVQAKLPIEYFHALTGLFK